MPKAKPTKKPRRKRPSAQPWTPPLALPVFSPEEFIEQAVHVERVAIQVTDPTVQSGLGRVALMLRRAAEDRAEAIELQWQTRH